MWVWVSGSELANQSGVYGTQGLESTSNVPGAREASASWIDANRNFWIFGGLNTSTPSARASSAAWTDANGGL